MITTHKLLKSKRPNGPLFKNKVLIFLLFLFLAENFLYFSYLLAGRKNQSKVLSSTTETGSCPLVCQELIDRKINAALHSLNKSRISSNKTVSYQSLGAGGNTTERSWTVIPGSDFSLNLKDYPAGVKVYWVGNLKADYGNSRCYARIYDKTNFRAVDYSEQSSSQIVFENLTSQSLTIWSGRNDYQLEIKSLNGITCRLESPSLILKY
ncbi:MAG: hypothetical protein ABH867_04700 [Patescibacteria group bacterium]|nr:hypothetical protein [Patescibacteria group bacterium]